jgi:Tol biopolymer transport system component
VNESKPSAPTPDKCLRSWKEIAAYLECSVATAQRWEKSEGLPVHRHMHGTAGSVYAYVSDIENWRKQRTVAAGVATGAAERSPNGSPTGQPQGERKDRDLTSNTRSRFRIVGSVWPWAIVLVVGTAGVLFWLRHGTRSGGSLVRFDIDVGMELPRFPRGPNAVLSPDGSRIVFSARGPDRVFHLYTRALDSRTTQLLAGTENASWAFFSPDGRWIGYFAGDHLMKMPVEGGPSVVLCGAPAVHVRGASWGSDGNIIAALAANSGLMRVPQDGGTPVPVTELDREEGEVTHRWPQVLPGARAVLFTASTTGVKYDDASIEAQWFETGRRKTLIQGGYFGRYLPSGHLVYARGTTLFAVPMDVEHLELKGSPTAVLDDLVADPDIGSMQFDFSQTGTALCMTGKWHHTPRSLVWVDRGGNIRPMAAPPQAYGDVRVSPDGKRLAVSVGTDAAQWYIALYDWERDRLARLTFGNVDLSPQWFPDGSRVAFASDRHGGMQNIYAVRADGNGEPERVTESRNIQVPFSFAQLPLRMAFVEMHPETGEDIWTLTLAGASAHDRGPAPFLCTPADESAPAFSPDGRWIAYQSNEAGRSRPEVYVRSWSRPQIKWQVSTDGGRAPVWAKAGKELYYENKARSIMMVRCVAEGDALLWTKPVIRFAGPVAYEGLNEDRNFDPGPDGKLAVIVAAGGNAPPANRLTILLDFFDELRRRTGR